jgi:putative protease
MAYLHGHLKKGYLTLNTVVMNDEIPRVEKILKEAKKAQVDAVILWDMSVLELAKKIGLPIHLSTQASVSNIEAVKFYAKLGVSRIVLARECTLLDIQKIIKEIKRGKVHCEIETFIHGAMCVSISGRCFLSLYSHGKSANQGQCIQPCRREFYIQDVDKETNFILGKDYVLSPKDLCAIDFIDELISSGIHAFKIEGRMRSPEYVQVVTSSYRKAIDAYFDKKLSDTFKSELKKKLACVYSRGFSNGFYFGRPDDAWSKGLEHLYEKIFVGQVTRFFKKISVAEVRVYSGTIKKNEEILFIGKSRVSDIVRVKEMRNNHEAIDSAKKGDVVGIKLPFVVKPHDKVFLWKRKA